MMDEKKQFPSGKTEPTEEELAEELGTESAAEGGSETEAEPEAPDYEAQLAQMQDKLLRSIAEMENLRRRTERDREEALRYGIARFARDILTVADNLRRAVEAVPPEAREAMEESLKNLIAGVEVTERELLAVFERHGIRRVDPAPGEKFDPNLHQAMAEVPHDEHPRGSVVHIAQPGYVIGERLLRPAMVTVARPASAPAPQSEKKGKDAESAEPEDTDEGEDPEKDCGGRIDTTA